MWRNYSPFTMVASVVNRLNMRYWLKMVKVYEPMPSYKDEAVVSFCKVGELAFE